MQSTCPPRFPSAALGQCAYDDGSREQVASGARDSEQSPESLAIEGVRAAHGIPRSTTFDAREERFKS